MDEVENAKLSEVATDIKWIIKSIENIEKASTKGLCDLDVRVNALEDKQNAIGVKLALIGGALIYGATFAVDKIWSALTGK